MLGQLDQRILGIHCAPASEDAGLPRLDQRLGRRLNLGWSGRRRGGRWLPLGHTVHLAQEIGDVVGNLHEYRPRFPGGGGLIRFVQRRNDIAVAGDPPGALGNRLQQRMLVHFV